MRTPQAVKDAAKFLTDAYPTKYDHVGVYKGYEVYTLRFIGEPPIIGYPEIYMYKEGKRVKTMCGPEVFPILDAAAKNTRERRKAARLAREQDKLKE